MFKYRGYWIYIQYTSHFIYRAESDGAMLFANTVWGIKYQINKDIKRRDKLSRLSMEDQ